MPATASPLTPAEISLWSSRLLGPVTAHVRKHLGEEASDLTGGCLFKALHLYDKSRGDIEPYAKSKTHFLVIEEVRSLEGRKGTARHEANRKRSSVEDYDAAEESDPSEDLREAESLRNMVKTLETAGGPGYGICILIGKIFCGCTETQLQGVLGVSKTTIYEQTAALRQLVPLD